MYEKKKSINEIKDRDRIEDVFVVKIKKGISQYAKGYSFNLLLSDSSGKTIDYKFWGGNDENKVTSIYDPIKSDSVVFVQGKAQVYNNKLQISTNEPDTIKVLQQSEYNPEDFVMAAKKDVDQMFKELMNHINNIQNQEIKLILQKVFEDQSFASKFKKAPAAIEIHHNWVGGLLQHILEIIKYCELSKDIYDLDEDLLIAGAILHDIGKVDEIEVTSRIKGTKTGQLQGHIHIGFTITSKIMDQLNTSQLIRDKILHLIVSHHGKVEFGSAKEPMFPEAFALYYADELSSKITEIQQFIKSARESTEDDFMYHRRYNRNILLE